MFDAFKKISHSVVNTVNSVSQPTKKTIDAFASRTRRKRFLADLELAGQHQLLVGTFSEASLRIGKDYFLSHSNSNFAGFLSDEDLEVFSIHSEWTLKKFKPPHHIH